MLREWLGTTKVASVSYNDGRLLRLPLGPLNLAAPFGSSMAYRRFLGGRPPNISRRLSAPSLKRLEAAHTLPQLTETCIFPSPAQSWTAPAAPDFKPIPQHGSTVAGANHHPFVSVGKRQKEKADELRKAKIQALIAMCGLYTLGWLS